MVVYGSYLRKEDDIVTSAISVGLGNTLIAVMAGFAIFPAVFSFNLRPEQGPELAFVTIPLLCHSMPAGALWGVLFFFCLFIAGITSTIGIIQVVVDGLTDRFGWSTRWSALLSGSVVLVLGLPASTNPIYFDLAVKLVTVWLLPLLALVAGLAFLWSYGAKNAREHINCGTILPLGKWWEPWAKYVYPATIIIVLLTAITLGIAG
jgi:NSS family neurotransmitter:Na+ symporter